MDKYLVDYIASGEAWMLVGSGPSIQMGYPSWHDLAQWALRQAKTDYATGKAADLGIASQAFSAGDYPKVFGEIAAILGMPRLMQIIRERMTCSGLGRVYELICKWPIPVYLTTNYDDALQNTLASVGESYNPYSNSESHMAFLVPGRNGAVVKLHGDLRSDIGFILTDRHYREIQQNDQWLYWRTKMTSILQMNRVVIIGHSLKDPNIRHVLEAAKQGAGIEQPVCWIAPYDTPQNSDQAIR